MRFGNILAVLDGREGSRAVADTSLALVRENCCQGEWLFVQQRECSCAKRRGAGVEVSWRFA